MTLTAAEVWRDYNTDGVPASGPHPVNKRDVRAWAALFEAIGDGGGPGLGYETKGFLNNDLAHAAGTLAVVYGDSTASNNGVYIKVGISGAGGWTRISDLPGAVVPITVVSGGSANAIVASAPQTPVNPGAKLYLLTPTAQNTAATTISVNGGAAVPIKNAFGFDLASGSLLANSQVLMAWSVDHYQLLISANVDASSILAAAQSAATSSASSATDAAATAGTVAGTVGGIIAQTYTEAAAATIPTDVEVVTVNGYTDPGDGPPAPYVSRLSEPSHSGKFLSNGVWRELERHDGVYLEDFGGKNSLNADGTFDTSVDNVTALTDAIDYCVKKRRARVRVSSGYWPCKSGGIVVPVGIGFYGQGMTSSQTQGGTNLVADYDEATPGNVFIGWDGSGEEFNGTGGGIQNMDVMKGAARTGGTLCKITGVNDSFRPGYMVFQNVRFSGTNQGADCDYCFIVDGSNLTTSSTQGLRDITMINTPIDGWTAEGAQFVNATHLFLSGFVASPTNGAGTAALRVTGATSDALSKTNDAQIIGAKIYGTAIFDNCNQSLFTGRATDLVVTGGLTNSILLRMGDNPTTFSGVDRTGAIANGNLILDGADEALYTAGTKVVGLRQTGFVPPTGATYLGTYDPSTVNLSSLAQRVAAIENAITAHGLIGA